MSLLINIDVQSLAAGFKEYYRTAEQAFYFGVQELSKATHQYIAEEAANGSDRLKSSLTTYQDALSKPDLVNPGTWVIALDESALWIEDGKEAGDMKAGLLKGAKFKVIPFNQNKRPQNRSAIEQGIFKELESGLRKINKNLQDLGQNKITLKPIEYAKNGSPLVGKLHELEIKSSHPTFMAKHPALKGLAIYQNKDKETGAIKRDVLTFRTVSVNSDPNSWWYPGFKGKKYFEKAHQWAMEEWENNILPKILKDLRD